MTANRIFVLVLAIAVFVACMVVFITADKYIPPPGPRAPVPTMSATTGGTP